MKDAIKYWKILIVLIILFSTIFNPLTSVIGVKNQLSNDLINNIGVVDYSIDSEYYAIVIGIDNFINIDLRNNNYETAYNFYKTLLSGDNWKKENIMLIQNENATKNNIKNSIIKWLDSKENKDDIILIYFVGNSYRIPEDKKSFGNAYILPFDFNDIEYSEDKITDLELNSWLNSLESQHISLFFDTQFSGYMNKLKKFGRVYLTSNGILSNFRNIDNFDNKNIFSKYLIRAIGGDADFNRDEGVSIYEIFRFLRKNYVLDFLTTFKDSLINKNFSRIFSLCMPSIFDLHFGKINVISLSFGWKQLSDDGLGKSSNYATRGMIVFKDELYIGTQNNKINDLSDFDEYFRVYNLNKFYNSIKSSLFFDNILRSVVRFIVHFTTFESEGCEIWKYNYSTDSMTQIIGDNSISGIKSGFNYSFNAAASVFKEFNGYLYVGTWNTPLGSLKDPDRRGCEIWRSLDGVYWEQVVGEYSAYTKGGFGNPDNVGAWCIEEFNGFIYVGTMNWDFTDQGGCEIWRSSDGLYWEQVVDHGFRPFMVEDNILFEPVNTYAWIMEVFRDQLYVGTFNSRTRIFSDRGTGCQLWRTSDGINWNKVLLPDGLNEGFQDGFGESENYGIRKLTIYNDELYVGVASNWLFKNGCEIWKYDGKNWTPIISDEIPGVEKFDFNYDGFGNSKNKYIWSMTATSDGKLWVGTANVQIDFNFIFQSVKSKRLLDSLSDGFEIWCYDGNQWIPIVKNDIGEKSNGIGDTSNLGARSMIEYPLNSGNIVIGSLKMVRNNPPINSGGCEIWMHSNSN